MPRDLLERVQEVDPVLRVECSITYYGACHLLLLPFLSDID
jgi:hypothetical protein